MIQKLLVLIIVFSVLLPVCNAQEVILTDKEQNAVALLKMTMFLQNIHGPVFLDVHDYDFHRDESGNLLMVATKNPGLDNQLIGDKYFSYKITNTGNQPSLIELLNECERHTFIRINKWDGHKIESSASRGLESGKIIYDANGKIIGLDSGLSYSGSGKKKIYRNTMFYVKYNKKGSLAEMSKDIQYYKSSSSAQNLKKDFTFQEYLIKVNYGENVVTLTLDMQRKNDKKIAKAKSSVYTITKSDFSTTEENVTIDYRKKGENKSESSIKMDYDQQMRLVKKFNNDQFRSSTVDYSYNNENNIIEENYQTTDRNNVVKEELITRKFNAHGLVLEITKVKKVDNKTTATDITKYNYLPLKEGDDITKCSNKKEESTSYYNAEGELYKESSGNKLRVKENGVWGPWKPYTM